MSFPSQEFSVTKKPVSSKLDLSFSFPITLSSYKKFASLLPPDLLPGLSPSGRSIVEWPAGSDGLRRQQCSADHKQTLFTVTLT